MRAFQLGQRDGETRFEGFLSEMKSGRSMRLVSFLSLATFLSVAVAPLYMLTYGVPHLLSYFVLFWICDRATDAPSATARQRYLNLATALRIAMVVHTCWAALDLRFGHHLKAESTLLITASLVLAAMQLQPGRVSYLLGLAPPLAAMLGIIAIRPVTELRTGIATLLLTVAVLATAIRQQKISRKALVLQAQSDAAARALADSLSAAELADEVASLGHWRVGPAGEHIWSPGVFRIFGLPAADTPPSIADAIAFYREEDQARVGAAVAQAMADREGFTFEHRIIRADGSDRTLLVKCRYQEKEDGGWLLGVVQDVTEQRVAEQNREESERRYRLLADNAGDMIVQAKLNGRITYISPACLAVTGYAPHELVGRTIMDFMVEEDAPQATQMLVKAITARSPDPWRLEYRVRRKDGTVIWLECHPRVSFDDDGKPIGLVDVVRDADARKTMEGELVAARQAAEAGAQAKADFLANMSHELRTPLNSIVGFSHLITQAPELAPETRRRATLVHDASRSLVAIVNDVLDVSRIDAEGVTLRPEPVEVGPLVQSVVDLVRREAEGKGLDLSVQTPNEPVRVMVDAVRLRQVLLNLVGNAVKFTERGSVLISLTRDAEDRLRFAVRDTGLGIPAGRQAAIFQRFAQADGSTARRFGGSGLGLTICQSIVEAMGGEIGVLSTERAGSTFWFAISAPEASKAACEPQRPIPKMIDVSGARLLLADDNAMNRDLFAALLEDSGVEITFAENGAEALRIVQERAFDIVFMDVQMPVMDGFEATRAIRSLGLSRLPIVALTANVLQPQVDQCRAAGMNSHLGKPFRLRDVLEAITDWVKPAAIGDSVVQVEVLEALGRAIGAQKMDHFLGGLAEQLHGMGELMATPSADIAQVARQAHQVRGYAASLGYVELGDRYRDLENACKDGSFSAGQLLAAQEATRAALDDIGSRRAA